MAVIGLSTVCNGDRAIQYVFKIASGTIEDKIRKKEGYRETKIKISAIDELELFNEK